MRKKMLFLALALAATGLAHRPERPAVDTTHSCRFGCRSCICNSASPHRLYQRLLLNLKERKMRKKMLLLALALTATASLTTPPPRRPAPITCRSAPPTRMALSAA